MEIRGARESELEELISLQRAVFLHDDPDALQRFRTFVQDDPSYRLHQSRVVVDNGRIVGCLRVWDRRIRVRGAKLRAGGIGSVLTHPDFRGRSYAKTLMRKTEGYLYREGYDLRLLFTAIGTLFYASLGWTSIPLQTCWLRLDDVEAGNLEGMVCQAHPSEDLEHMQAIYRQCCQRMTGPEVRSKKYWLSGPSSWRGVFPIWVVVRNGQAVAYVNTEVELGRALVKEECALWGMEGVYQDLGLPRLLAGA